MDETILEILSVNKFNVVQEKQTQSEIQDKFSELGMTFEKEYRLDTNNIPDFFIDGIAIEVKIKGSAKNIYQQCKRYCMFDQVKELILVTNRSMGFPKEINGKPCYVINLGRAWL